MADVQEIIDQQEMHIDEDAPEPSPEDKLKQHKDREERRLAFERRHWL
jgi:hypothetical protein